MAVKIGLVSVIPTIQDGTQLSMVDEETLWVTELFLIPDIKESQICLFQDAAEYLPSLWLEPSSWKVNTSCPGPHGLYPRGQKSSCGL